MSTKKTKKAKSSPTWIIVLFIFVIPFLGAYLVQKLIFDNVERPPPDFGSGSMFDQIATRYDIINRVLALRMDVGWRQRMANEIQQRLPKTTTSTTTSSLSPRLLDVATGTADVALQLLETIPTATILGVDPSNNMLHVGREKIQQLGYQDRIELVYGDARDLTSLTTTLSSLSNNDDNNDATTAAFVLSDNTFDGATMAFGIRNVPQRELALCEIHRLLKPNGVLAIMEFSEPDDSHGILGIGARMFIRHIVPIVGGILSGAPKEYVHLQNSIKDFPTPPKFRSLLQNLNCGSSVGKGDTNENENANGMGHFNMEEVIHMNFGSVQLYVGTAVKPNLQDIE